VGIAPARSARIGAAERAQCPPYSLTTESVE
jgi:hypothetical protein